MKILLLGANGQLGRSFVEDGRLARLGDLRMASRDGRRFDGGLIDAINLAAPGVLEAALDAIAPDVIVNTAAYTAVDRAEHEEALAMCVNGEAVGVMGRWATANRALVMHYSTDYVFDGNARAPYQVNDPTGPLGTYARSKLAGEEALAASDADHLVFRTAWVYADHGHNFLRTMLRLGAGCDVLDVVADQYGSPTSTDVIIDGTLAALCTWKAASADSQRAMRGIHHLTASGSTTWHGFACSIFEAAHRRGLLQRIPTVRAIKTVDYPTPAMRPAWSVLSVEDMREHFDYSPPHWRDALVRTLDGMGPE